MVQVTDFAASVTTPVLIASGVGEVLIQSTSSGGGEVYLGDSSMSYGNGYKVMLFSFQDYRVGDGFRLTLGSTDELYALFSTPIRVLRTR